MQSVKELRHRLKELDIRISALDAERTEVVNALDALTRRFAGSAYEPGRSLFVVPPKHRVVVARSQTALPWEDTPWTHDSPDENGVPAADTASEVRVVVATDVEPWT